MGLSNHTRLLIAAEGIVILDDLAEFTQDSLESVFYNLCKPPETLVLPVVGGVLVADHLGILTEV